MMFVLLQVQCTIKNIFAHQGGFVDVWVHTVEPRRLALVDATRSACLRTAVTPVVAEAAEAAENVVVREMLNKRGKFRQIKKQRAH